ncbi:hypothetical protein FQZ97_265560 [compost metagenome]
MPLGRRQERRIGQGAVLQQVVVVADLVQGEGGVHAAHPAGGVLHAVDRFLGQLEGEGRFLRDVLRQGQRGCGQVLQRHHLVDHAQAPGFVGVHPAGGEEEFLGLAHAHFPGMHEEFGAADAHADGVVHEPRVVRGDDQVARPGQHQATGDAFALHLRDGRLGNVAPALAQADVDLLLAGHLRLGAGATETAPGADRLPLVHGSCRVFLAELVARREVRAVGGEDDDLDLLVGAGAVEGVVQFVEQMGVLGVALFRLVQADPGDVRGRHFIGDPAGFVVPLVFLHLVFSLQSVVERYQLQLSGRTSRILAWPECGHSHSFELKGVAATGSSRQGSYGLGADLHAQVFGESA